MEDRGGLRYRIEAEDKFTRTSQSFRSEMKKNRAEFARFRQSMSKSRGDAGKFSSQVAQMNKSLAAFGAAKDKMAARDSIAARDAADVKKLRARYERVTQILAKQRQMLAKIRNEQRGVTAAVNKTTRAVKDTNTQRSVAVKKQRAITQETQRTGSAANRLSFTFRRLFGILAAFQAARMGVRGFVDLIKTSIDFNRQIEDSRISIAALIVATARVKDEQGKTLKGAQAFAAAQKEAARQSSLLRQDALKTTATYGELLKAFQAGVGPGLEAGLNLDQIREVTIRVSQAAGALGLAQNQLIEEIRSLLRGTIQARTTIVASVLGITNADVRRAKEAGNLFEFLSARLEGFKLAAAETQNTVSGLIARLRDALGFAAGIAGVDFFAALKQSLRDIFSTIVDIKRDSKGVIDSITPNPTTVKTLAGLFNGLKTLMETIREGLKGLDISPITEGFMEISSLVTGSDMKTAFEAMVALADVIGASLGAALASIRDVSRLITPLLSLVDVFSPLIALIVRFRVAWWAIHLITLNVVKTVALLPGLLVASGQSAAVAAARMQSMKLAAQGISIALVLAAMSAQPLIQTFLGINASMSDSIMLLSQGFVDSIKEGIAQARILKIRMVEALTVGGKSGEDFLTATAPRAGKRYALAFESALNVNLRNIAGLFGKDNTIKKYFDDQAQKAYDALKMDYSASLPDVSLTAADQEILDIQNKRKKAQLDLGKLVQDVADRSKNLSADQEAAQSRMIALQKTLTKYFIEGINRKEEMTDADRLSLFLSHQKAGEARLELNTRRDLLIAEREGVRGDLLQLKKNELERKNLQIRLMQERMILKMKIEQQRNVLKTVQGTAAEAGERQKLKLLLYEEKTILGGIILDMETLELQAARLGQTLYGTVTEGMTEGLRTFADEFSSAFNAGVNIIRSTISELSSFISTSIVDAFDPSQDFDIVERFAQLMQQIARVVIEQLVQLAIAKSILSLGGWAGGGDMSWIKGSYLGKAEGGTIPNRPAPASVRPQGLHPTDRVPIWAAQGEFMQRASAVKRYGLDVMEKINSGLINPSDLRALAGARSMGRARRSTMRHAGRSGGFAAGGEIPKSARTAAAEIRQSSNADQGPTPAFMMMDAQAVDRMLNTNRASFMKFFRGSADSIKGSLGIRK